MGLYEKVDEFTPDSLFTSPDYPVLKEGIGLKKGQGVLKRGSLIMRGSDKHAYLAGTTVSSVSMKVFGILTDDVDTGSEDKDENIPATCYITGHFNRGAVIVKPGSTIDTYADDMKGVGMYLQNVQKYE